MLDVCPADRGGALRAEREVVASPVLERLGLFLHHVRRFSNGAVEQACGLENRRVYALVAETVAYTDGVLLNVAPVPLDLWEEVNGATRCLIHGFAPESVAQEYPRSPFK